MCLVAVVSLQQLRSVQRKMKWLYREHEKSRNGFQEIMQVFFLGGLKKTKGRIASNVWKKGRISAEWNLMCVAWNWLRMSAYLQTEICFDVEQKLELGWLSAYCWFPTSTSGLTRWDEDGQFGPGTSGYLPPFPVYACLSLGTRETIAFLHKVYYVWCFLLMPFLVSRLWYCSWQEILLWFKYF